MRLRSPRPSKQLTKARGTPDEETDDWRAVCGRTAPTRREGRRKPFLALSAGRDAAMQGLRLAGVASNRNSVSFVASWLPAFPGRVRGHDPIQAPVVQSDR